MNAILAIALPLRLAALFLLGTVVAAVVNVAIYRLAWRQRSISPWTRPPALAPSRRWSDKIPIVGWWGLQRESGLHGRGFWIRPILIDIFTGLLFAGLYYWEAEVIAGQLMPAGGPAPAPEMLSSNIPLVAHAHYVSHLFVMLLMLIASLIDFDEKTIPDAITIPGTNIGLLLAALYPWSLLPFRDWLLNNVRSVEFLTLASPEPWPEALCGWPLGQALGIALGCWTLWCGGLLPRRWNMRRGWTVAARVFLHRLRIDVQTYRILPMWLAGAVAITLAAGKLPNPHWAGLVTALVGVAAGGGIIWIVRVVGTLALKKEAMGFGDVTLMSMIGAFVGWQAALVVFFVAPFLGLVMGLFQWVFHREHEIPYGPFLCLATCGVIVRWASVWEECQGIFALGWLLPALLAGCFVLMGIALFGYRNVVAMFRGRR